MNTLAAVGLQLAEKAPAASEFISKLLLRQAELLPVIGDAQAQKTKFLPKLFFVSVHRAAIPLFLL